MVEYRVRRRDGQFGWFVGHGAPRYGDDGTFLGFIGGALDITERKEAENALRDLTGRVISAEEADRRRTARELHDGINQLVALLAIDIEQLGLTPIRSQAELAERTRGLWERTAEISSELRRLSHALHPARLETFGLAGAIEGVCAEVTEQHGVQIQFSQRDVPSSIPPDTALCVFRIVQEALRNVVKHSGAPSARVDLARSDGHLSLRVSDTGLGFDRTVATTGLGLVSMGERVRFAKGNLTVQTAPGEGTRIDVRLPLPVAASEGPARETQPA
jgi:signal transduction histidine kinase